MRQKVLSFARVFGTETDVRLHMGFLVDTSAVSLVGDVPCSGKWSASHSRAPASSACGGGPCDWGTSEQDRGIVRPSTDGRTSTLRMISRAPSAHALQSLLGRLGNVIGNRVLRSGQRVLGGLILSTLLAACGTARSNLVSRSTFDLSCPAEQITVTVLEGSDSCLGGIDACGRVAGVRGCGQQATYVNVRGTWVQNSGAPASPR